MESSRRLAFQATTHVMNPFAAASKIIAKGNRIVLDDERSWSCIENKATGTRIPLKIENGVYVMEVVTPNKTPFGGRRIELRRMRPR